MSSNLTNDQLLELLRERGLVQLQQHNPPPTEKNLAEQISKGNVDIEDQLKHAQSVRCLPEAAKTAILDYAISELLKLER